MSGNNNDNKKRAFDQPTLDQFFSPMKKKRNDEDRHGGAARPPPPPRSTSFSSTNGSGAELRDYRASDSDDNNNNNNRKPRPEADNGRSNIDSRLQRDHSNVPRNQQNNNNNNKRSEDRDGRSNESSYSNRNNYFIREHESNNNYSNHNRRNNDTKRQSYNQQDSRATSNNRSGYSYHNQSGASTATNSNNNDDDNNNIIHQQQYQPPPPQSLPILPPTYIDAWDGTHVKLPCSPYNTYRVRNNPNLLYKWYLIKSVLEEKISDCFELQNAILRMNPGWEGKWDFSGFTDFFTNYLPREYSKSFFEQTLPRMQRLALQLPNLVKKPIPLLSKNQDLEIVLNQRQIACLLTHAFFCTFPRRNSRRSPSDEYYTYPSINFVDLYKRSERSRNGLTACAKSQAEKLKAILHYFDQVTKQLPTGRVSFHRRVLTDKFPDWAADFTIIINSNSSSSSSNDNNNDDESTQQMSQASSTSSLGIPSPQICDLTVHLKGTIEDDGFGMLQVDFANKMIGGGAIGRGCVQEEIRFMINPELLVSRLFTEVIGDEECVVIKGAQRFSRYSGYGDTFEFTGHYDDVTPCDVLGVRNTEIVAIDALDFSYYNIDRQYHPIAINRELNKAYCGFFVESISDAPVNGDTQLIDTPTPSPVATGNWGCGVFAGDRQLKSLLQLMAASQARRPSVHYFTYGDADLAEKLEQVHTMLRNMGVRVCELYQCLLKYRVKRKRDPSLEVFTHVTRWFLDVGKEEDEEPQQQQQEQGEQNGDNKKHQQDDNDDIISLEAPERAASESQATDIVVPEEEVVPQEEIEYQAFLQQKIAETQSRIADVTDE